VSLGDGTRNVTFIEDAIGIGAMMFGDAAGD